jgi:hypothetical protein
LPMDDLFVLQSRLRDLQTQLVSKEKSMAEESATHEREDVEEQDRQRARAELAAGEELASLRERIEHQRQELADRDREIAQYQRAISATKELETAAATNSTARTDLAVAQKALAQAEARVAVLDPENLRMREELSSLTSGRAAAAEAVDLAERELRQQTEDSERVEAEATRLREDCDRLREQLREARAVGESATAEAAESARLLAGLRAEPERLAEAQRLAAALEQRLQDSQLENQALRSRTDAAVDAAAGARSVEGVGGSALTVLRYEVRVLKAQLVEVKAERDAANEAASVASRQASLAEQDVAMLRERLALAAASVGTVMRPEEDMMGATTAAAAGRPVAASQRHVQQQHDQQQHSRSISPSLDAGGGSSGGSPDRRSPPVEHGGVEAHEVHEVHDVHVSWSESSLTSEHHGAHGQHQSGSSSGSGGSDGLPQALSHGRLRTEPSSRNATAFHTPAAGGGGGGGRQAVAPSVALTAMWSRDVGSDVEARRLRQELGEANATNQQLRSALSQMNRALHL